MANCLWDDTVEQHRYHLVNWETVSMFKDFGGLGIPNLRDLNLCFLGSWVKRYQNDGGKLWREVIDFKYDTRHPNLFSSNSVGASDFFEGVIVGNGRSIKFWEDNWLGTSSLAIQFWDLYEIVNEKGDTIANLWDGENLMCTFRRTVNQRFVEWLVRSQTTSCHYLFVRWRGFLDPDVFHQRSLFLSVFI
jgi:hypothetical protein